MYSDSRFHSTQGLAPLRFLTCLRPQTRTRAVGHQEQEATKQLDIVKSGVSKRLAVLEKRPLLTRTTRTHTLT